MWIYKHADDRTDLINTDHVQAFYTNGVAVYAAMKASNEKIISFETKKEAEDFMQWLAGQIGDYKSSKAKGFGLSEYIVLIDDYGKGH